MRIIAKDLIDTVRTRIGDTSRSVPASAIMAYMNTALRRLARQDGLEKLFEFRDTFDLSSINKDGTPSAAWDLGKVGVLLDIPIIRILKADTSQICELRPGYKEVRDFYMQCPMPEQNAPGDPDSFTIESVGGDITRLLFNRPPRNLVSIDLWYSAFHPRVTTVDDEILVPYEYCDILEEYIIILHNIETTDDNRARALTEDLDLLTTELVELLARRKKALPYRRMARSF